MLAGPEILEQLAGTHAVVRDRNIPVLGRYLMIGVPISDSERASDLNFGVLRAMCTTRVADGGLDVADVRIRGDMLKGFVLGDEKIEASMPPFNRILVVRLPDHADEIGDAGVWVKTEEQDKWSSVQEFSDRPWYSRIAGQILADKLVIMDGQLLSNDVPPN